MKGDCHETDTNKREYISVILLTLFLGVMLITANIVYAADFAEVESILGVKAEMHEDVCVFRFPRNDINVTIDGDLCRQPSDLEAGRMENDGK